MSMKKCTRKIADIAVIGRYRGRTYHGDTETRRARSEETQPQIHAEERRSELAIYVDLRRSAATRFLFFSLTSLPPCLRGGFFPDVGDVGRSRR